MMVMEMIPFMEWVEMMFLKQSQVVILLMVVLVQIQLISNWSRDLPDGGMMKIMV